MKPLIWIIDEEWPDYELETALLKEAFPGCDVRRSPYDYRADLAAFGHAADAILCQVYARIPRKTIEALEKCRVIAVYGGGYDRVDIEAARKKGVAVTNVSGYCAEDLAEYVVAAVYHFNKGVASHAAHVRDGRWGAQAVETLPGRVSGSRLHIVGLGRIGAAVAGSARALGMEVTAFDPHVGEAAMRALGVRKTEWAEGLKEADYISVNAILTPETTGLIGYEDFRLMKPSCCLINTARGKILREADLIRAVREGLIRGAMLDVIENEPPAGDEAVLRCPGIFVTPHVSYISQDSFGELKRRAAANVIAALNGAPLRDWVNTGKGAALRIHSSGRQ